MTEPLIASDDIAKEKFHLSDAVKMGKDVLMKMDPGVWSGPLETNADDENSKWKKYKKSNPGILKDPVIKNLTRSDKKYWIIYYSANTEEIVDTKVISHGQEAFVFIDPDLKEIINILLWERKDDNKTE